MVRHDRDKFVKGIVVRVKPPPYSTSIIFEEDRTNTRPIKEIGLGIVEGWLNESGALKVWFPLVGTWAQFGRPEEWFEIVEASDAEG